MSSNGVMKLLGTITGTYLAIWFADADWQPLPRETPNWEISNGREPDLAFNYVSDPAKKKFFIRLYETFESHNPGSEVPDLVVGKRISNQEYQDLYKNFDRDLFRIRIDCPIKSLVVTSKWDDQKGINRNFTIFDIEKCKKYEGSK